MHVGLRDFSLIPRIFEWVKIHGRITKAVIYSRLSPEFVATYCITELTI